MNSFLISMFIKEALIGVLIISLVKIFTNKKNKNKLLISLSFDVKMDKLKTAIL